MVSANKLAVELNTTFDEQIPSKTLIVLNVVLLVIPETFTTPSPKASIATVWAGFPSIE